jgi:hypothetical protein
MTTLYSVAGAIGRGSFNVLVNAGVAFLVNRFTVENRVLGRDMTVVVAVDTVFRIAITHVLDALKIPFLEKGTAGHLLFPCLTLLTQPLSSKIVRKFYKTKSAWNNKSHYFLHMFGSIAIGWKANMMLKDVMYLTGFLKT